MKRDLVIKDHLVISIENNVLSFANETICVELSEIDLKELVVFLLDRNYMYISRENYNIHFSDLGIKFDFRGLSILIRISREKLAKFIQGN